MAERKRAQYSRKMLVRTEKTFSIEIEVKCLVGQKNVQHRRKMLSRAEKTLSLEEKSIAEKLLDIAEKCPAEKKNNLQSSNVQVLYLWATVPGTQNMPWLCEKYRSIWRHCQIWGLFCLDLAGWLGNSQVIVNNWKLLSPFISPQILFYRAMPF